MIIRLKSNDLHCDLLLQMAKIKGFKLPMICERCKQLNTTTLAAVEAHRSSTVSLATTISDSVH